MENIKLNNVDILIPVTVLTRKHVSLHTELKISEINKFNQMLKLKRKINKDLKRKNNYK